MGTPAPSRAENLIEVTHECSHCLASPWERAPLCLKQPRQNAAVPLCGRDFSTDAGRPQDAQAYRHALAVAERLAAGDPQQPPNGSAKLGWDAVAVFGCCRHRPLERPGGAGLLWLINGGRLVELYREWAVIELAESGSPRIF